MTVLITGAGLVGSQVAAILVGQGQRPRVLEPRPQRDALRRIVDLERIELLDGDVLKPYTLTEALRDGQVTAIVHTAAYPLLTLGAQRNPYAAIELNIMGLVNVMEAARIHGIRRVVVSSSSVLNRYQSGGEDAGNMSREEAFPRPNTFYAATKQAVESIGLNYARAYDITFAALRYCPVFGPWSGPGGGGPSGIFRDMLDAAIAGGEAVIPGTPMEWVYSKDAAMATVQALTVPDTDTGVFNITMGRVFTPDDLAMHLTNVFPGVRYRIEALRDRTPFKGDEWKPADISRARERLGYEPRYSMEAAMRDYVRWHSVHAR